MNGRVVTVLGEIGAEELGVTDCHEHLAAPARLRAGAQEKDFDISEREPVEHDLRAFAAAGGSAIVDMTPPDYGRDLESLAALSRTTGVHVIAVTGFVKGEHARPFAEGRAPAELAREQIMDIVEGRAGIRCGAVKAGSSLDSIEPCEDVILRAAALTHLATGCPISTHTESGTMAVEQLDLFAEEGVSASSVILGHLDKNPDLDLYREVARRGAFFAFDHLPKAKHGTLEPALKNLVQLAREGLDAHVLVGGDFSRRTYYRGWGGEPGLDFLLTSFRPRLGDALDRAGLDSERVLERVFVTNAARALAFAQPAPAQKAS